MDTTSCQPVSPTLSRSGTQSDLSTQMGKWTNKVRREARLLELDWIKKEKVYDYRSRVEAEKKGIKPIPWIWVEDTNKGDKNTPFVRSRICVRECKKGRNAEGVPEDFSQGQAFEASSFRHFPGALYAESTL